MNNVLLVTTDIMSGRYASAIARVMQGEGHKVTVAAEGKSLEVWEGAGFEVAFDNTGNSSYFGWPNAVRFLESHSVDVVVVGTSSPANIEVTFAKAAVKAGVPLVMLEDIVGGHTRLGLDKKSSPGLILSVDSVAVDMAEAAYPTSRVEAMGHFDANLPEPNPELEAQVEVLRDGYGLVVVFGGQATTEDLELAIECIELADGIMIPRFHPKIADQVDEESGLTLGGLWWDMIEDRLPEDKFLSIGIELRGTTDQLVAYADVTLSGFSTLLTTAALAGRVSGSLWTPEVEAQLYRENQIEAVPQVTLGISHSISEPVDLVTLEPRVSVDEARVLVPAFDPASASKAIEGFVAA